MDGEEVCAVTDLNDPAAAMFVAVERGGFVRPTLDPLFSWSVSNLFFRPKVPSPSSPVKPA